MGAYFILDAIYQFSSSLILSSINAWYIPQKIFSSIHENQEILVKKVSKILRYGKKLFVKFCLYIFERQDSLRAPFCCLDKKQKSNTKSHQWGRWWMLSIRCNSRVKLWSSRRSRWANQQQLGPITKYRNNKQDKIHRAHHKTLKNFGEQLKIQLDTNLI